jgi:hypothetical protein
VAVTETATPSGVVDTDERADLVLGNLYFPSFNYFYNFNGYLKDVRIYDRLLTATEVVELASDNDNFLLVPDGLVFQSPCVKEEDYAGITGTILYTTNKMIDNIYGVRGTPNSLYASGTAWSIKAYDPNF